MATETASFGAGKRESHDASAFYRRRLLEHAPTVTTGEPQTPPDEIIDALFCSSSEAMTEIHDDCVALMVTSPPYNVGKDYDDDLTLDEYLALLHRVLAETAEHAEEIDVERALRSKAEAEEQLKTEKAPESFQRAEVRLKRAISRIQTQKHIG